VRWPILYIENIPQGVHQFTLRWIISKIRRTTERCVWVTRSRPLKDVLTALLSDVLSLHITTLGTWPTSYAKSLWSCWWRVSNGKSSLISILLLLFTITLFPTTFQAYLHNTFGADSARNTISRVFQIFGLVGHFTELQYVSVKTLIPGKTRF
jgi:hypothetical protein